MNANEQITAAIGAHGMWKTRLRTAIESGKADTPIGEVRDDRHCAFGKWLYDADQATKQSKHYAACVKLHAHFHGVAADVMALATAGKKREASKALEVGQEFGKASADLTSLMRAWQVDTSK